MIKRTEIATGNYRTFEWDHRNRLITIRDLTSTESTVQLLRFVYDSVGRRLSKTNLNTSTPTSAHYVYDREDIHIYITRDGDTITSQSRNLHAVGADEVIATDYMDSVRGNEWLLSDHLGSIRDIVNDAARVLAQRSFDSFGKMELASDSTDSIFGFTGRERDNETGLSFFRARYVDTSNARFLSEDPLRFQDGFNIFTYVRNQPLTLIDPFGLYGETCDPCKDGEKLSQIKAVGPIDAWTAKQLADEATAAARTSGFGNTHNDEGDAWRHCYWSCRMAQKIGKEQAKQVGDIHEACGKNPPGETAMDLKNNQVGRDLANTPIISAPGGGNHCSKACTTAVKIGQTQNKP
jgi:RHS repeat-associated protein